MAEKILNLGEGKWVYAPQEDMINNPPHYNMGKIEVIDFIIDQGLDYLSGNVIKYVARAPHKGAELQDLKKAKFCLEKRIELLEQT